MAVVAIMKHTMDTFQSVIVDLSRQLAYTQQQYDCSKAKQGKAWFAGGGGGGGGGGSSSNSNDEQRVSMMARMLAQSEADLARTKMELAEVMGMLKKFAIPASSSSLLGSPGDPFAHEAWNPDGEDALRVSDDSSSLTSDSDAWCSAEEALNDMSPPISEPEVQ